MITQFLAVMTDSLRLLRSRSLFWASLILSAIAAIALFSTYSFKPEGIRFFWFDTWKNPLIAEGTTGPSDFVGFVFNGVFVRFWLGWGAMILAIISTASILPEFLASGSIDMALSKPISRMRMFAFKIIGAMLFVALQVTVGVALAYLIIGLKFDIWLHKSLWAIPLITLQFFYVYSISALLAVITRSTLVCVMGTALLWLLIFLVQFAANIIDDEVNKAQAIVDRNRTSIVQIEKKATDEGRELTESEISRRTRMEQRLEVAEDDARSMRSYQRWTGTAKMVVPKTGDIKVIIAKVADAPIAGEFFRMLAKGSEGMRPPNIDDDDWDEMNDADDAAQRARRNLDTRNSIVSSLVFSFSALGLAGLLFWRRDF